MTRLGPGPKARTGDSAESIPTKSRMFAVWAGSFLDHALHPPGTVRFERKENTASPRTQRHPLPRHWPVILRHPEAGRGPGSRLCGLAPFSSATVGNFRSALDTFCNLDYISLMCGYIGLYRIICRHTESLTYILVTNSNTKEKSRAELCYYFESKRSQPRN